MNNAVKIVLIFTVENMNHSIILLLMNSSIAVM